MDIVDIANLYIEHHNEEVDNVIEHIEAGRFAEAWRNRLKWIRSLDDGHILRALKKHIIDQRLQTAQTVKATEETLTTQQVCVLLITNLNEVACAFQAVKECYRDGQTQYKDPKYELAADEIIQHHYFTVWERVEGPEPAAE